MSPASDGVPGHSEQRQNSADDEYDDANRPDDPYVREKADNEEYDTEDDHFNSWP